jgi:hypothetical protein
VGLEVGAHGGARVGPDVGAHVGGAVGLAVGQANPKSHCVGSRVSTWPFQLTGTCTEL